MFSVLPRARDFRDDARKDRRFGRWKVAFLLLAGGDPLLSLRCPIMTATEAFSTSVGEASATMETSESEVGREKSCWRQKEEGEEYPLLSSVVDGRVSTLKQRVASCSERIEGRRIEKIKCISIIILSIDRGS